MKLKLYLIICLLFLMGGTCKKESPSCHHNIVIENNSSETVIYALKFTSGVSSVKCLLEGYKLLPNENVKYDLKYCWEDELSNGKTFEFISPNGLN